VNGTTALVLFGGLILSCTYTLRHYNEYNELEPIVISDRVGEVIDVEERAQFGLFRGIEDFKSAQYFGVIVGGYDVIIQTTNKRLIVYNRDPDAVEILRDYLNRYDVIRDSMIIFEKKWDIVDYDDLGQPITKNEVSMNVRRIWQRYLPAIGATAGCFGSCLLFGAPEFALDVPSDYDDDNELLVALHSCSCLTGYVSGWLVGNNLDKRIVLSKIREARKPRVVEEK
jgi:hypothetical protein